MVIFPLLQFVFVCFHDRLRKTLKRKTKKIEIADHTIMVVMNKSEKPLSEINFEDHFSSLLHQAGFGDNPKVLSQLIITPKGSFKDIELKIKELLLENECLNQALKVDDLKLEEKDQVENLQKKASGRLERLLVRYSSLIKKVEKRQLNQKNQRKLSRIAFGFILISNQLTRDRILKAHFEVNEARYWLCRLFTKSSNLTLSAAPEPSAIVWKNIYQPPAKRIIIHILIIAGASTIFLFLLYIMVMVVALGIFLIASDEIKKHPKIIFGPVLSWVFVTAIEILFWLASFTISKFSGYSLFLSKGIGSKNRTLWLGVIKLCALYMLGFTLVLYSRSLKDTIDSDLIYILMKQMVFQAVLKVLRIRHIVKIIKMIYYKQKAKKSRIMMIQKSLNKIFKKPECEIEVIYSLNIFVIIVLFGLLQTIPIGSLVCVVYLLFNMQVNKLLFYRFYAEPGKEKQGLSEVLLLSSGFFVKTLCLFNLSNMFYLHLCLIFAPYEELNKRLVPYMKVITILSICIFFLPFGLLLKLENQYLKTREFTSRVLNPRFSRSFGTFRANSQQENDTGKLRENLIDERESERRLTKAFRAAYGQNEQINYEDSSIGDGRK